MRRGPAPICAPRGNGWAGRWPRPRRTLRIRPAYIDALEEGRLNLLPGNAYALGFLRTYATRLGLDPDEMLRRFRAEASGVSRHTELAFPAPVPERGLPAGAVVLLGLLLVVGAYAGWYRLSGEGRLPAETVMAVPERLAPLAEQAVKFPDQSPAPPAPAAPVAVASTPPAAAEPASAFSPTSAAAAPVNALPGGMISAVPPGGCAGRASARAAGRRPDAPRAARDRRRLDAGQGRGGPILLNRVLKAGETWPVPAKANLC